MRIAAVAEAVRRDALYSLRQLSRSPVFVITVILVLGAGIGATAALYGLVSGVLGEVFSPDIPQTVTAVRRVDRRESRPTYGLTLDEIARLREYSGLPGGTIFTADPLVGVVARSGAAVAVNGELVSGDYFDGLGVAPLLGRMLTGVDDTDHGDIPVVVSERLWRSWFSADRSALGARFRMAGHPLTVVGVAPGSFRGTWLPSLIAVDVWVPLTASDRVRTVQGDTSSRVRTHRTFVVVAGAEDLRAAQARVQSTLGGGQEGQPNVRYDLVSAGDAIGRDDLRALSRWMYTATIACTAIVFAIACANLINLALLRIHDRRAELAVRRALGATGVRLALMLTLEVGILASGGVLVGWSVALLITYLLTSLPAVDIGQVRMQLHYGLKWPTYLYGLGMGMAGAALVAGAIVRRTIRLGLIALIQSGGVGAAATRPVGRLQRAFLIWQVWASVALVIMAAACFFGARSIANRRLPLNAGGIFSATFDLAMHGFSQERGQMAIDAVEDAVRRVPGVIAVGVGTGTPDEGGLSTTQLLAEGDLPRMDPRLGPIGERARYVSVAGAYFDVFGLRVRKGRPIRWPDDANAAVAVINESAAALLWPGRDSLGRRLRIGVDQDLFTVIGVLASRDGDSASVPRIYVPATKEYSPRVSVFAAIVGNADRLATPIEQAIHRAEPELALFNIGGADRLLAVRGPLKGTSILLGTLGLIGFLIALVGLNGTVSYLTALRRREFSIRSALGASRQQLYVTATKSTTVSLISGAALGGATGLVAIELCTPFIERLGGQLYPAGCLCVAALLVIIGMASEVTTARRVLNSSSSAGLRME